VNGENEQGQNGVYGMVHHCTGAGVKSRNVFNIVDLAGENSMDIYNNAPLESSPSMMG
jgi:hypothetical protein